MTKNRSGTPVGKYAFNHADHNASTFNVPSDNTFKGEGFRLDMASRTRYMVGYIHVWNGWDVNVDVTPRGAAFDDSGMSEPVEDGSAETVQSGGNGTSFLIRSGHSFLDLKVEPAADPTSGNLKIRFQARSHR